MAALELKCEHFICGLLVRPVDAISTNLLRVSVWDGSSSASES